MNRSKKAQSQTEAILGRGLEQENAAGLQSIKPAWRVYYSRLLSTRSELVSDRENWKTQQLETQPKDRQQADAESATTIQLRDAALGRVESYEEAINEINGALRRIEDGSFGICELTGQRIEQDRLAAEPWTRYCAAGQRELEQQGISARAFDEGVRPCTARREGNSMEEEMKGGEEVQDDELNDNTKRRLVLRFVTCRACFCGLFGPPSCVKTIALPIGNKVAMRATSLKLDSVRGLLIEELRDLQDAGRRVSEANKKLTRVAESKTNPQIAARGAR